MESDRRYFVEGLFVIVFSIAVAFFFLWLSYSGKKDDVIYRIHFTESVSGLSLGDPVKFLGVEVGTVKDMTINSNDPSHVQVDIRLRKDAPVKTDTKAVLKYKGITGSFFIDLDGGSGDAQSLVSATPHGQIPEIAVEQSSLDTVMDQMPRVVSKLSNVLDQFPKVVSKFSAIEDQARKVVADIGDVTKEIKQNPSLLLRRPKENKDSTKR